MELELWGVGRVVGGRLATTHLYPTEEQGSKAGSIPRVLARPPMQPISQEKVAEVDPELEKVPVQYIRDGLRHLGPQYVASVSANHLSN